MSLFFVEYVFFSSFADYIAEEVFKCIGNRKTKLSCSTTLGRKILITKILSLALNAKSRGSGGHSVAIQIGRPTGSNPLVCDQPRAMESVGGAFVMMLTMMLLPLMTMMMKLTTDQPM